METIFFYMIRALGKPLQIEEDRRTTGLFPLETWMNLMGEAGFTVEKLAYPVHDDPRQAYLLVGTLS